MLLFSQIQIPIFAYEAEHENYTASSYEAEDNNSFYSANEVAASDNTNSENKSEYETKNEEYIEEYIYEEKYEESEKALISIVPANTALVNSWAALVTEVLDPTITTIVIENDITIPTGASGNAILIPAGRDVTITSAFGEVYKLFRDTSGQRHFIVNGTLRLENIAIQGNYPAVTGNHGGIQVNAGGSLYIEDGTAILNNRNTTGNQGGGVTVSGANATLTMTGGTISGNSAFTATVSNGVVGGVFVHNGAVFTMYGGEIYENEGRLGGGVTINASTAFLVSDTQFIMEGGVIHGNRSTLGGGINLERGTFTMIDGMIQNNTATGLGNPPSTTIQANRGGGGVFVQNAGSFNMSGGTIYDNISHNNGGGVKLLAGTLFSMSDGLIIGNNADNNGGGVHVTGSLFTMNDGKINGNTSVNNGGGIWLGLGNATSNARLNMHDGEISGNTALTGGGGGIFTSAASYVDPVPSNAYLNILNANGSFSDNTAGNGKFAIPSNYNDISFGTLLTNYNINYRGTVLNVGVTFVLNNGNVAGSTANIVHSVPLGYTVDELGILPDPMRVGHTLIGWTRDGSSTVLSINEVRELQINEHTTFTAVWQVNQTNDTSNNGNGNNDGNNNIGGSNNTGEENDNYNTDNNNYNMDELEVPRGEWTLNDQAELLEFDEIAVPNDILIIPQTGLESNTLNRILLMLSFLTMIWALSSMRMKRENEI